jgi:hydrogenase/urease accessory protein HupE
MRTGVGTGSRVLARAAALLAVLAAAPAEGHQFAPSLLELTEVAAGRAEVRWKQPMMRVMGSELRPVLPPDCAGVGKPAVRREGTAVDATWTIDCRAGLIGRSLGVEGIAESRADVLLRVELADGRSFRRVLTGDAPSFAIPAEESRLDVTTGYAALGVEHILTGFDHLLFVLGLTLLVGYGRTLLWTITAFTLGHSITLALAVLGFVRFPSALIEAAIALSIYVLAVELVQPEGRSLLRRHPWPMAAAFGLLHGLGFAGALAEVGLPKGEIPLALLSFNLGIEAGQLLFVAAVLAAQPLLRRLFSRWPRARLVPAYGIGALAVFWLIERTLTAAALAGWR